MSMFGSYAEELITEDLFEQIPGVERIGFDRFSRLAAILSREESEDSYITSPVYYAYTGRRGLWLYQEDDTYVLFCWHPNVNGQILVFPPLGKRNFSVVPSLLHKLPHPPEGVLLARFKSEDIRQLKLAHNPLNHIAFLPVSEDTLDWQYAVRILSTEKTAAMHGHDFMLVRNRVRQASKHSIEAHTLSKAGARNIRALAHRWAYQRAERSDELNDLMAPYESLLRLLECRGVAMDGLVFCVDGEAHSAILWDISNTENRMANVYMNLSSTEYKGLSEFSIKTAAETLSRQGVRYMNLGGSETAGLDRYKQKFMPTLSVDLCSAKPILREATASPQRLPAVRELVAA